MGADELRAERGQDAKKEADQGKLEASDPFTDLGLTLPVFVIYHLGVVVLPIRNAADPVTSELKALANHSLPLYAGLTLAIGAAFVLLLLAMGRGKALRLSRFFWIGLEGVLYAFLMRMVGAYALEALPLATGEGGGLFTSIVMSLGAGFYEEVFFRVGIFGAGAWVIRIMMGRGITGTGMTIGWALVAALGFSLWHHIGPMADPFDLRVFVYRTVCGLFLTAIYVFRGFAPAVWTHALYDIWAMA